jgi:hypothetical protein
MGLQSHEGIMPQSAKSHGLFLVYENIIQYLLISYQDYRFQPVCRFFVDILAE